MHYLSRMTIVAQQLDEKLTSWAPKPPLRSREWYLSSSSGHIPMLSISCPLGESSKRFSTYSMRTKPGEVWLPPLTTALHLILRSKFRTRRCRRDVPRFASFAREQREDASPTSHAGSPGTVFRPPPEKSSHGGHGVHGGSGKRGTGERSRIRTNGLH